MRRSILWAALAAMCLATRTAPPAFADAERLRLIIETDAGGDPDDEQSLVRFLLYANEWDVEEIIANRPVARDGENRNPERTGLGIVRRLLDAYGECRSHLAEHDSRYPTKEYLWERTVAGYNDTDVAVDRLIEIVDRPDPRPVWYSDWGTDHEAAENNLRRALDRVLKERGPEGYAKFKSKLRLSSTDRFEEHTTTIEPPFPIWVDTWRPEIDRKRWYWQFSEITRQAGGFNLQRDCLTNHGPLGALYPTNTTHDQKEGDTLSFLYLVPTGMNDPEQPTWGSWAGRYGLNENFAGKPYYWANQEDAWQGETSRDNTLARWAAALQNDFRARLDWCVTSANDANHPPRVRVAGELRPKAHSGDTVRLDAASSDDPDGDSLDFHWEAYPEVTGFEREIALRNAETATAEFIVPKVNTPTSLHLILTATDRGDPPLSRYARVIVTIEPTVAETKPATDLFPSELVDFVPDPANPVFTGAPGEWDAKIRERGWILHEGDLYKLWYTGYDGTKEGIRRLGYATSRDGVQWTRHPGNPLIKDAWVEDMTVVKHDGKYWMFAEGLHDQAQLLSSEDGIAWTRLGSLDVRLKNGDPIPEGPYGTPTAWHEDDRWRLLYERGDRGVWLAESTDMKVWTNVQDDPVLSPGPAEYDHDMIAVNQVIQRDGRYYAYYHGSAVSGPNKGLWSTAIATSTDLIHWEKYAGNPLFPVSENKSSGILVDEGPQRRLYTMHPEVNLHRPRSTKGKSSD